MSRKNKYPILEFDNNETAKLNPTYSVESFLKQTSWLSLFPRGHR